MIELYLAFGLLTIATVAAIILPLLRQSGQNAVRADYDLRVYRDQLGEIERDLDRGLTSPELAEAARTEVKRRMLTADTEAQGASRTVDTNRPLRLIIAISLVALLPIGTLALYLGDLGSPRLPDRPWIEAQAERTGVSTMEIRIIRDRAAALEERTHTDPRNQDIWLELGELGMELRQFDKAVGAYDQAMRLGNLNAETWANFGQAMVQAARGEVTPNAKNAFIQSLRLNRDEPASRWYLGLAAMQDNRPAEAIAILRDLNAATPDSVPWKPMVRQRIAMVAQQVGVPPIAIEPAHPLDILDGITTVTMNGAAVPETESAAPADGAAMRAEADANRAQGQGFTDDERAMISGMVEGLKQRLDANPADFDGWMRLGRSMQVLGDPAGAADAYKNAVDQKPDDLDARFNYAKALLDLASAEQAGTAPDAFFETVAFMQKAAPDKPDTLYMAGLAAQMSGDLDTARTLWTRLLALIPEGTPARDAMQAQIDGLGS